MPVKKSIQENTKPGKVVAVISASARQRENSAAFWIISSAGWWWRTDVPPAPAWFLTSGKWIIAQSLITIIIAASNIFFNTVIFLLTDEKRFIFLFFPTLGIWNFYQLLDFNLKVCQVHHLYEATSLAKKIISSWKPHLLGQNSLVENNLAVLSSFSFPSAAQTVNQSTSARRPNVRQTSFRLSRLWCFKDKEAEGRSSGAGAGL